MTTTIESALQDVHRSFRQVLEDRTPTLEPREVGTIESVGRGIAQISGLPHARAEELLMFPNRIAGLAFNVDADEIGAIVLGDYDSLESGMPVRRTGRVLDVPVGDGLIGRIVDPSGRPLDDRGTVAADERRPVEIEAPAIMDRDPVTVPLQTGIKTIDALIPIGRGQRELILGDRQTGKTAITTDTIINQADEDVLCIYCAIGQRNAAVASVVGELRRHGAMDYTTLLVASCDAAPGLQFVAPYAATTIAEHFMRQGRDVLIVYDDLTKHARSYRELSLLLRRPPGREAFPGDIFYVHSRLLERATHLRKDEGGGSLTALPIIETEAQNMSAYIPTNLISITDGQVYLSPDLFRKGQLPAIDVGKSVSRVGGKAQLPVYRAVAGDLRLSYSQFEELERFSRFGTRLDEETRQTLEHGTRVREVLKQTQSAPIPVADQVAILLAVAEGVLDDVPRETVGSVEQKLREFLHQEEDLRRRLLEGDKLSDEDRDAILELARKAVDEGTPRDADRSSDAPAD